jgi:hypothetical protein
MVFVNNPITGKEATQMRYSNQGRFQQQVRFLRRQFLQDGDLQLLNNPMGLIFPWEAISAFL